MNMNEFEFQSINEQIAQLAQKQKQLQVEIDQLKAHVLLQQNKSEEKTSEKSIPTPIVSDAKPIVSKVETPIQQAQTRHKAKVKSDWERIIGENLISKIGIIITILGVGIGSKYAIDKELISPATRILLGYLFGLSLLGIAIRLKKSYENFSSVLLSGSMAILYFITFFAYAYYHLMSQQIAFGLMFLFTLFTVLAALKYNKQVIAHIGLVGAYVIPFLLSNGSGNVVSLLIYMLIINSGILILSILKNWKALTFVALVFTWTIFLFWVFVEFNQETHLSTAFVFCFLFYILFYTAIIIYNYLHEESSKIIDIVLILINSIVFFLATSTLSSFLSEGKYAVLFTLFQMIIHAFVGWIFQRKKGNETNLVWLAYGLSILFLTVSISIHFEGNWTTVLWMGEAVILFTIGRLKKYFPVERMSYPLLALVFFGLIYMWGQPKDETRTIFLNASFISTFWVILCLAWIQYLAYKHKEVHADKTLKEISDYVITIGLISIPFLSIIREINFYWEQKESNFYLLMKTMNSDFDHFKQIWMINFSLLYFAFLNWLNVFKLRIQTLGWVSFGFSTFFILLFLILSLFSFSSLREDYLHHSSASIIPYSYYYISIRYISFIFLSVSLTSIYHLIVKKIIQANKQIIWDLIIHIVAFWVISSEFIHWMEIFDSSKTYKLGLSIVWGLYSVTLLILGIWKKRKYLRITSISLFGFTLLKLFFYDITHLETISKTIIFITLGILLLLISYLYNRFKSSIFDTKEE